MKLIVLNKFGRKIMFYENADAQKTMLKSAKIAQMFKCFLKNDLSETFEKLLGKQQ